MRVIAGLAAFIAAWLAAAIVAGATGVLNQQGRPPLAFGLFLAVPPLLLVLAYATLARMRRAVDRTPLSAVTAVHLARLVGVAFVVGALDGTYPPQFGLPAGIGDIISALVAIPLTLAIAAGRRSNALGLRYVAWNLFGLADLVAAITLGLLYSNSVVGVLRDDLTSDAIAELPISLVPTFYVPILVLLHVLGLRRSPELKGGHSVGSR